MIRDNSQTVAFARMVFAELERDGDTIRAIRRLRMKEINLRRNGNTEFRVLERVRRLIR